MPNCHTNYENTIISIIMQITEKIFIHKNYLRMTKNIYKIKIVIQAFSKKHCFICYNISHSFLGVSP